MTEAQRVQEAIDRIEKAGAFKTLLDYGDDIKLIISLARSYLTALQSGEVPEDKEHAKDCWTKEGDYSCDCGARIFNSCRSQMLDLIVARDRRIEELERREG